LVGDRIESSSGVAMEGESLEGECLDERPRKAGGRYIAPPNSPLACIWFSLVSQFSNWVRSEGEISWNIHTPWQRRPKAQEAVSFHYHLG